MSNRTVLETVRAPPSSNAVRRDLEQRLLADLATAFPQAFPNHVRPLDGRVVEHRATEPGQPARAVTDYELAGAYTFGIPAGPEFVGARSVAG